MEHITAGVFVLKFLYSSRNQGRVVDYKSIASIKQLQNLRNSFQRDYERTLKKDWVELRKDKKFLHYEEIQQVCTCVHVVLFFFFNNIVGVEKLNR